MHYFSEIQYKQPNVRIFYDLHHCSSKDGALDQVPEKFVPKTYTNTSSLLLLYSYIYLIILSRV